MIERTISDNPHVPKADAPNTGNEASPPEAGAPLRFEDTSSIRPTVGRVVYAFHASWDGPRRADVIGVNEDDATVNLAVTLDPQRDACARAYGMGDLCELSQVYLRHVPIYDPHLPGDMCVRPGDCRYAEWMPYQKGQAQKTEEAEKQAAGRKG